MSRRQGRWATEQRAADRARIRRDQGDPLPYMEILRQERNKMGIIAPVHRLRTIVNVVRSL